MAGYISSCLFGGFTGPMSDKYGRKRLGQVCIIGNNELCSWARCIFSDHIDHNDFGINKP